MKSKVWIQRLERHPEAKRQVMAYATVVGLSKLPNTGIGDEPIGEVHVHGQRFAALAVGLADAPKMRPFWAQYGYDASSADRLQGAQSLLMGIGFSPHDEDNLGHQDVGDGSSPIPPITGVPAEYIGPEEIAQLTPHWKPGVPPTVDRVWPSDWAERRIKNIPNRGPLCEPPTHAWPNEHHYPPLPATDPFGDRAKYPDMPRRRR
jgi:hypothetical protein